MKSFIISQLYKGDFLKNNIGGEIINFLYTDNGENYIFIPPYGTVNKKYEDTVNAVFMTRMIKKGLLLVVGISIVDKVIDKDFDKSTLFYGKTPLNKIVSEDQLINYKSKKVLVPKKQVYIVGKNCKKSDIPREGVVVKLIDKATGISSWNKPTYISDNVEKRDFESLNDLLLNKSYFKESQCLKVEDIKEKNENMIEIMGKEYDELAYSKMLRYYLDKYRDILDKFVCKLGFKDFNAKDAILLNEYKNIDLYIEDKNNIIVIENKIKSNINGVEKNHDFSEGGKIQNQLSKYRSIIEKEKNGRKTKYIILTPDYNRLDLARYSGSSKYNNIKYSVLYSFFNNFLKEEKYSQDILFKNFVESLSIHSGLVEKDYYIDMLQKCKKKIELIGGNSHRT